MGRSLRSVSIVFLSLVLVAFASWIFLRDKSVNKRPKTPFDHPFAAVHADGRKLLLRQVKPSTTAAIQQAIKDIKAAGKENPRYTLGLWLDVRLVENEPIIATDELLPSGKPVEIATVSEVQTAVNNPTLASVAPDLTGIPVVLNLIARRPGLAQAVLRPWERGDWPANSILLQSESEGPLKELREQKPQGYFGSGQATLIQIEVLANLGLAGLMDLKSDALISLQREVFRQENGETSSRIRLRASTLDEAHRRGLKRYAGPAQNADEVQTLLNAGYDGVIVDDWNTINLILTAQKE